MPPGWWYEDELDRYKKCAVSLGRIEGEGTACAGGFRTPVGLNSKRRQADHPV